MNDMKREKQARTEMLRGTLDLLVLKSLSLEPLHGVAIADRLGQMTQGTFQVSFGSLFPCLHKMEEKGWTVSEWRMTENSRRAKYYRLTDLGRRQLEEREKNWNRLVEIMNLALRST